MRAITTWVLMIGLTFPVVESVHAADIATPTTPLSLIYVMNADGTGWEKFFQMPQIGATGSLQVSHDGKYIAYDGWMSAAGEGSSDSRLFVISTQRDELWLLGNGSMPTWGPDNTRLACSFYSGGSGIMTITTQEIVTIDRNGWGTQWSPDGKSIAYAVGRELRVYDVESKKARTVFNAEGQYTSLGWNGVWSPDSRRFLFHGTKDDGSKELTSVAMQGKEPDMKKHLVGQKPAAKLAWHPTQPRLIYSAYDAETKRSQMFEFDPTKNDPPQRLAGQDATLDVMSPAWTPDGKRLYCIARPKIEAAKP